MNAKEFSVILYYKGKAMRKLSQIDDSILIMEQIVKLDDEWGIKAIYFLAKIRVKQKNFYEAHHTLTRLVNPDVNSKISKFKSMIEGVLLIKL